MFLPVVVEVVLVAVVFGLDNHSPSGGEDIVVKIELHGLEEEAAEDGNDSQVLSIGKMHETGSWGHAPSLVLTH